MKTCTGCGESKELNEFHRCAQSPDGFKHRCKTCRREASRQWRAANIDRCRANEQQWAEANPDRMTEYKRRWAERNPDAQREAVRRWDLENPERRLAIARAWYQNHQAEVCDDRGARRAAVLPTREATERIAELLQLPCTYCGSTEDITIDHIVPLTRGGKHEPDNLTSACRPCNGSKGARLLDEWPGRLAA